MKNFRSKKNYHFLSLVKKKFKLSLQISWAIFLYSRFIMQLLLYLKIIFIQR